MRRGKRDQFHSILGYYKKKASNTKEALYQTLKSILEGYWDAQEALEDAQVLRQVNGLRYDISGIEITPETIEHAVEELKKHPEIKIWAA